MTGRLNSLVWENAAYLDQIHAFLLNTPQEWYVEMRPPFARGGIGKHIRHVLEFYQLVLGAENGVVDYDSRKRESILEEDPEHAASRALELKSVLRDFSDREDEPVTLVYSDEHDSQRISSTIGRELMFLTSHTVHHMAIIRMIYELLGGNVPDTFGVAPSTLRYEESGG